MLCENCGQLLFFENSRCLRCGKPQGFDPEQLTLVVLADPQSRQRCANAAIASCNWLVEDDAESELCRSCRLTRTRPADDDTGALVQYAVAEAAKRRLLFELFDLPLPVDEDGLRFDLLSSASQPVVTGHSDGVITIDLAETDDVRREQRRAELQEPYRTMLGHFRHEIAHFYWPILVQDRGAEVLGRARALFGDERADYQGELDRHYAEGPPADWAQRFVTAYATMHPWEDWAETFAHYLHIRDTLQTAAAFGLIVTGPDPIADPELVSVPEIEPEAERSIDAIIAAWLPLTYALNAINRSMGLDDLYPFTLAPKVIEKLGFVHDRVRDAERLVSR